MGLLDWVKNRNRSKIPVEPGFDPREHGHKTWKGVFAEIRHDEALAKRRDATGREPESSHPKVKADRGKSVER